MPDVKPCETGPVRSNSVGALKDSEYVPRTANSSLNGSQRRLYFGTNGSSVLLYSSLRAATERSSTLKPGRELALSKIGTRTSAKKPSVLELAEYG